jgi:hypothetical protein
VNLKEEILKILKFRGRGWLPPSEIKFLFGSQAKRKRPYREAGIIHPGFTYRDVLKGKLK